MAEQENTQQRPSDGGPAFPSQTERYGHAGPVLETSYGMSLRDYFAAHAPQSPPEWFNPQMPPCPKQFYIHDVFTDPKEKALIDKWFDDEGDAWFDPEGDEPGTVPQELKERMDTFLKQFYQRCDEVAAWKEEKQWQRYFQWRYHYADQMIKARDNGSGLS